MHKICTLFFKMEKLLKLNKQKPPFCHNGCQCHKTVRTYISSLLNFFAFSSCFS